MTYSEFGRRISENGAFDSGTDHGTCAPQFIIGKRVNGELYGSHPNLKDIDADGNPFNEFEFRNVYASVLGDWFGVAPETAQTILSPGRAHDPFATTFPINGSGSRRSLIDNSVSGVTPRDREAYGLRCSPNPCYGESMLSFQLDEAADVTIELFDGRGVLLQKIDRGRLLQGTHEVAFDLRTSAAGTYYFRLRTGARSESGRLVRLN